VNDVHVLAVRDRPSVVLLFHSWRIRQSKGIGYDVISCGNSVRKPGNGVLHGFNDMFALGSSPGHTSPGSYDSRVKKLLGIQDQDSPISLLSVHRLVRNASLIIDHKRDLRQRRT
jgi:hypothetical protein